ncbi:MAG: tetratricopeptide repeat protein [Myxococcota bacterium]
MEDASPSIQSGLMSAAAGQLRQSGALERALRCLDAALDLPVQASGLLHLERAKVLVALGRPSDAAVEAERALAAGLPEDIVSEFLVPSLALGGREGAARSRALASRTHAGRIWATALGDSSSAREAAALRRSVTPRGAWASLALAHFAHRNGRTGRAIQLAEDAERRARQLNLPALQEASVQLQNELRRNRTNPAFGFEAVLASESVFNPRTAADASDGGTFALGRVGGHLSVDVGQVRGRLHASFTGRAPIIEGSDTVSGFGVTGTAVADVPVSGDPSSAVVQLGLRISSRWLDAFSEPVGSAFEAGPSLWIPLSSGWNVGISAYGVRVDISERFTVPDDSIDPTNRDFVGQRVALTVIRGDEESGIRLDAFFASDQADGTAFDSVGGGGAARATRRFSPGWVGVLGLHLALREFGPAETPSAFSVGETVLEIRSSAWFEIVKALTPRIDLVLRGRVVDLSRDGADDAARATGTLGMEGRW